MTGPITVSGLAETRKMLSKVATSIDTEKKFVLRQIGGDIVADAKNIVQQHGNIRTGELLGDIRIVEESNDSVTVGTTVGQGAIIEYGRAEVRPVAAKVLHWVDDQGRDVFSKKSKAVAPQPFMAPAVLANTRRFKDLLAKRVEQMTRTSIGSEVEL